MSKNRWNKFEMIDGHRWELFTVKNTKQSAVEQAEGVRRNRGHNARILSSKKGKKHPWSKSPLLYRYAVYFRKSNLRKKKIYITGKGWI